MRRFGSQSPGSGSAASYCPAEMDELRVIGCSLDAVALSARRERLVELREQVSSVSPSPTGFTVRFVAGPDTEAELRAVIAAEAECCPTLRLELRRAGGFLDLEIAGPPGARAEIESFLAPSLDPC
jgi:hypothetical protein